MGVKNFWVLHIIMWLSLQARFSRSQNLTCNSNDLKALEGFLADLESTIDGWASNSSTDCCNWVGITCNTSSNRIVKLELSGRKMVGKLSPSLGFLDYLQTLNLSSNFLAGSLPDSLFQLPNLEVLDLSSNDFTGSLPLSINLPSIESFNISENSLVGYLPVNICDNSTRTSSIILSENHFYGDIPAGFGNCSSLLVLLLDSNELTGGIAEDLFRLPNLSRLDLQDNGLSGQLSSRIGNLSNLIHLEVGVNSFAGSLPDVFDNFRSLQYFSAQSNGFAGKIPPSLMNSPTLNLLNLRNNSFAGAIDINCSAMTSLVSLDLGSNMLYGSIPSNLPSCSRLTTISLAKNSFKGQIPESFKDFQSLASLSLSNCSLSNLTAALHILQQCKNLTTLVLTLNFHGEELPADPNLLFKSLKVLVIASCQLSGSIPQWISSSILLQLVDLSWNKLVGGIPSWFGDFESLFYLDLSNNSLTGEIPKSLTGLQSLISRKISFNDPTADFPFFVRRNQSVKGLQYNQVESFPPLLDLSCNNLSGQIWPEFGNLKKLHILDLKSNFLFGSIPSNLSAMTSLETLDLSYNNLSGTIPSSLINLSFLSMFSVAYNQLYGEIPRGGQFGTFPNSSFEGNKGLCGEHASPCESANHGPHQSASQKPRRQRSVIVGVAVAIGFGTTFSLALVCLILLRRQRQGEVDPEMDNNEANDEDLEELGSRLVILFRNKDNNQELCIDDLLKSTNNFDQANIIGCGGFGLVYKATFPDGRKAAIKRLSGDCGQIEREFQAEVEALSRAQHPNLVLLQGYCTYKNDSLLMYSYMENSSLDYWLHETVDGPSFLDWNKRVQIAQGAARGLAYLHQSCEPRILHRDIKSSNILLDENFEAHLADFGLARLIRPSDTHVTTDLVGTLGYIPPEYGQASVATYKGDVYSLGVVFLELVTGKRPMDMCKPKGSQDLVSWVMLMKKEKRVPEIFDPFIYDKQNETEMSLLLEIACLCLSECPKLRPSTIELVSWLDNIDLGEDLV
ncbi:Leucine-rich repeat-containing N-terminal, plant-type [Dillenia turbinata]|uniref:non-specific serine/threonine protein kinase n=1 Tax=Dillenia turbinata TaxID=194707 RepID=A0AAN8VLS0_9MAGN